MSRRLQLAIDRLVIPAGLAGDRAAIVAALREDLLARIAAGATLPDTGRAIATLDGGRHAAAGDAAALGRQLGAVLAGQLLR